MLHQLNSESDKHSGEYITSDHVYGFRTLLMSQNVASVPHVSCGSVPIFPFLFF